MAASRQAIAASPAHDVAFAADDFTGEEVADVAPDLDDFADKFMPDHHRNGNGPLGPGVPFVDVKIGAADAGPPDLDQDVIDPAFRLGNVLESKAGGSAGFDEGFHVRPTVEPKIRYTRLNPV